MTKELEDSSPGWEAIDDQMTRLYGDQEPSHYGTLIPARNGGVEPIDGISAYRSLGPADPHWHFVTYGFSELHEKEWEDPEVSGFGFELTFRLHPVNGEKPPSWALNFLQNLGHYLFQTGNTFEPGHYMNLNGPIALDTSTEIKAIVFIEDPQLGKIDTPHGSLTFLQIVGITLDELYTIKRWHRGSFLGLLGASVPNWVTDLPLERPSAPQNQTFAENSEAGILKEGSSTSVLFVSKIHWSVRKPLLRQPHAEIVFGANGVRDLKAVLPGRLPFGRDFALTSGGRVVILEPGDSIFWKESREEDYKILTVTLPPDLAISLASTLMPKEGVYRIDGCDKLTFRVKKSYIEDRKCNIVEVVG